MKASVGMMTSVRTPHLPAYDSVRGSGSSFASSIWDSIAADKKVLALTAEQRAELDRRLNAYEVDGKRGRLATEVMADIRRKL